MQSRYKKKQRESQEYAFDESSTGEKNWLLNKQYKKLIILSKNIIEVVMPKLVFSQPLSKLFMTVGKYEMKNLHSRPEVCIVSDFKICFSLFMSFLG